MFKVELAPHFDSFEEFVTFMEPVIHKIEQVTSEQVKCPYPGFVTKI